VQALIPKGGIAVQIISVIPAKAGIHVSDTFAFPVPTHRTRGFRLSPE
jgi:hypothetical protein